MFSACTCWHAARFLAGTVTASEVHLLMRFTLLCPVSCFESHLLTPASQRLLLCCPVLLVARCLLPASGPSPATPLLLLHGHPRRTSGPPPAEAQQFHPKLRALGAPCACKRDMMDVCMPFANVRFCLSGCYPSYGLELLMRVRLQFLTVHERTSPISALLQ